MAKKTNSQTTAFKGKPSTGGDRPDNATGALPWIQAAQNQIAKVMGLPIPGTSTTSTTAPASSSKSNVIIIVAVIGIVIIIYLFATKKIKL